MAGGPRALTKPANAQIALLKEKSEAICASGVSCTCSLQSLTSCKLPCLQVCFLVLQAFSSLWQSVDFVNILGRRDKPGGFGMPKRPANAEFDRIKGKQVDCRQKDGPSSGA